MLLVTTTPLLTQSRHQIIEHLESNRQRTDPQKIEIQQRRNVLTRRINVWRAAQAVYMPQACVYLSDERDSNISEDASKFDNLKPETWSLFLPSRISGDDRSSCYKGIVETERLLRLAQLQDSLVNLRQSRRALRNLRLYFKTNLAGEGQKSQTRSRAVETSAKSRIKRAVWRYRTAHSALLELDPNGEWTSEYRELRDEDNRGPLKEVEETGVGDGRYAPSWIWTTPSATPLPCEGSAAEQHEVNETARYEWMTCRARADRWKEEEELLQEEMRRVVVYLDWKSRMWSEKVGNRVGSCPPDIQHGADAYARKQAYLHREIAISFAGQWLPCLKSCGYETRWSENLPWVSQALSRSAKLPRWFPSIPEDTPSVALATDQPPADSTQRPEMMRDVSDPHTTQSRSGSNKGRENGEYTEDYEGSDNGEEVFDNEYEGYDEDSDEESPDDEGYDNAETNGELGFEYDDAYMSMS